MARLELQRNVVEAVLALDEPYRGVIVHRYFDGLSIKAIARRLGVPVETVRTRSPATRRARWVSASASGRPPGISTTSPSSVALGRRLTHPSRCDPGCEGGVLPSCAALDSIVRQRLELDGGLP